MIADKAARGGIENQTDFVADLGRNHFNQFTPAAAEFFNDGSRELFVNVNDNTCEGIRYLDCPAFSVQFPPEACGGPLDTQELFDQFFAMMKEGE